MRWRNKGSIIQVCKFNNFNTQTTTRRILPTFDTLIRRSGHYNAWKVSPWSLPVRIEMLRLMNKWVLKFLILWSDEINHSNFENATKCLNKSWWYLLKHACFILKLKDFCNTCVHFNGRKQTLVDTIGILSALRMHGLHDKRQLLAKLHIVGSENYNFMGQMW